MGNVYYPKEDNLEHVFYSQKGSNHFNFFLFEQAVFFSKLYQHLPGYTLLQALTFKKIFH